MKSVSYSPCSAYTPAREHEVGRRPSSPRCRPCFTSFGRRPSTCEMRFCTSTAATSRLRVTSKVTVIVDDAVVAARRGHVLHALDAVDRLLDRRGDGGLDRLGARAVVERVDAAPSAAPARETARSAASGSRSAPARMMTSEQTLARIGRWMKVSTNTVYRGDFRSQNSEFRLVRVSAATPPRRAAAPRRSARRRRASARRRRRRARPA